MKLVTFVGGSLDGRRHPLPPEVFRDDGEHLRLPETVQYADGVTRETTLHYQRLPDGRYLYIRSTEEPPCSAPPPTP